MLLTVHESEFNGQRGRCLAGLFCAGFLATWLCVSTAMSQPTPSEPDSLGLDTLIGQLGSPSFREREQSSRLLVERGLDALPILRSHYDAEDQEIRERVRIAIQQIREIWKPVIIEQFSSNRDVDSRIPVPGWRSLKELLGDTEESRRLMAGILQREWDFLEDFELNGKSPRILIERCSVLQRDRGRVAISSEVSRETISAILLAASQLSEDAHRQQATSAVLTVAVNLYASTNTSARSKLTNDAPLRTLVAAFLSAPTHTAHAIQKLQFAAEYNFEQAASLARQVLDVPGCMPSQRHLALVALGRYGNLEDLKTLEIHLDDDTLAFRNRTSRNLSIQCQIRDAALFAVIQILKLPPERFGIPVPQQDLSFIEYSRRIGFPSDSERKQAFDQWNVERSNLESKQPKKTNDASNTSPVNPN